MITYKTATVEDMPKIAQTHKLCFPEYFLSSLGEDLLKKYYTEFLLENDLFILAEDENNKCVGFCMGYYSGSKAMQRFESKNKVKLFLKLLTLCLCLNKAAMQRCWARISSIFKRPVQPNIQQQTKPIFGVELLSICVLPEYAGKGISTELVNRFENAILTNDKGLVAERCVLTGFADNLRAIKFYEKMGYEILRQYAISVKYVKYFNK